MRMAEDSHRQTSKIPHQVECSRSPIFPFKIREIEGFVLWTAILDECQIQIGSGE